MRFIPTIAFAVGMFAGLAPAWSQQCGDASSQAELNVCAANDFKKADSELNASFKEIEKRLAGDEATKKLLVAAQRAWIGFRDAECEFQNTTTTGGSIHSMMVTTCKTNLTKSRVGQLKAYLHCDEGDMACPIPAAD